MAEALMVTDADLDVATRTLYGEARGESRLGQVAVAWVIRNRAEWAPAAWWGHDVTSVCQKAYQFSCWNKDDPNRAKISALASTDPAYRYMHEIVREVMTGDIADPTKGATHYEVVGTNASWAAARAPDVVIGQHAFYRLGPAA